MKRAMSMLSYRPHVCQPEVPWSGLEVASRDSTYEALARANHPHVQLAIWLQTSVGLLGVCSPDDDVEIVSLQMRPWNGVVLSDADGVRELEDEKTEVGRHVGWRPVGERVRVRVQVRVEMKSYCSV